LFAAATASVAARWEFIVSCPRFVLLLLTVTCGAALADSTGIAQHARRDAQRLADCNLALDADCVIELSDAKVYERLSKSGYSFADAQRMAFGSFKRSRVGWTKYEIAAPSKEFRGDGRVYRFVPYASTFNFGDRAVDVKSYLIGVSADEGETWKFVDGQCFTPTIIKRIFPSYNFDPLPPGEHAAKLGTETSYGCSQTLL